MSIFSMSDKVVQAYVQLIVTSDLVYKNAEVKLGDTGITPRQHSVLMTLISAEHQLTLTELSRRLFRTKNSLTTVIDHMERDGLVKRLPVPGDRRAIYIMVSEKGQALVKDSMQQSRELVYRTMSCLEPAELDSLNALLRKIRRNIPGDAAEDMTAAS